MQRVPQRLIVGIQMEVIRQATINSNHRSAKAHAVVERVRHETLRTNTKQYEGSKG